MATLFLGSLCLILSLGLTGSRYAPVSHSGSPDSQSWWDRDPLHIGKRALDSRRTGDWGGAAAIYHEGYRTALEHGEKQAAVRFLMSEGGCQLLDYRYRDALKSYLLARNLAASIHDAADLGAIALNLSSVYLQVWDKPAALRVAEEGLAATPKSTRVYWRAQLLLQLGRIHGLLGSGDAAADFADGIEAARAQDAVLVEATGWDFLGELQLAGGRLAAAERSFDEAYRLRIVFHLPEELGYSYARLGALRLAQGELKNALAFTERALLATRRGAASWPEHLLLHQRGRIRLAMGQERAALSDFSDALDAVARWRLDVLPARSSLTNANIALEQQIFHSSIEVAAEHAAKTGDVAWARKAFQATEVNRAASLRESLALNSAWQDRVPAEYWDILRQLAQNEAAGPLTARDRNATRRLRLKLTEMEAEAGLRFQPKKDEIFASQASLIHFQVGLRDSELFLSFFLGKQESYLWAVSRESLRLYRLAGEEQIAEGVQGFREALAGGVAEVTAERGRQLYRTLFGRLDLAEQGKTAWLLSLEGVLFEVPFAALVTERQGGNAVYLVEKHSLQSAPGALLLGIAKKPGPTGKAGRGWFLGVGDPVYNRADPRSGGTGFEKPLEMERLVGSGEEVEASARSWRLSGTATVLKGPAAVRERFLAMVRSRRPDVVHLATHVLTLPDARERGLIAFGLQPRSLSEIVLGRRPPSQFLGTAEIAALDVAGALVVMTGCSSGVGDVEAGAGLLGLTRAWMMAGAGAVVATAWPVEDNSGEMFSRFYGHLGASTPAEALRKTQVEMAHADGWRSAPVNWASYQLSGGDR